MRGKRIAIDDLEPARGDVETGGGRRASASNEPCCTWSRWLMGVLIIVSILVLSAQLGARDGASAGPGRRRAAETRPVPNWDERLSHDAHHHVQRPTVPLPTSKPTDASKAAGEGPGESSKTKVLVSDYNAPSRSEQIAETTQKVGRLLYPESKAPIPYRLGTWEQVNACTLVLLVVSDHKYQWWQLQLATYHLQRVRQPGKIVTLMTTDNPASFKMPYSCDAPFSGCPFFITRDYTIGPDGDSFVVYNRAHAIRDYLHRLAEDQAKGIDVQYTNVVIIEPDMLMLKPIQIIAERFKPLGFHYFYMEENYFWGNNSQLLKMCTTNPKIVRAIGVPYVIHIDDLRAMLPLWIDKTRVMRLEQPWVEGHPRSWIADMWGFACVLSDLGWAGAYDDPEMAPEPPIDPDVFPRSVAIHYTYGNIIKRDDGTEWRFDKRDWYGGPPEPRPFTRIPDKATPLQKLWMSLMDEALVAVFGEKGARQ